MTTFSRRIVLVLAAVALSGLVLPTLVRAADRQQELREKFKSRFPAIRDAKAAGKIGETFSGLLEAVDAKAVEGDAKLKKLLEEENADRHELFKLIAEKEKVSEEKVAERAAERNFEKAKSGEFLKDRDGKWKKKS